jgi:predicted phage terminase large subunit-like protein
VTTLDLPGSAPRKPLDREQAEALIERLTEAASRAKTEDDMRHITSQIAQVTRRYRIVHGIGLPPGPAEQAQELDRNYVIRPHIDFLSSRLLNAVEDVERGKNRFIAVSMPPRAGKSTLISLYTPIWLLRRHPEWKIIMASYDSGLTVGWARSARRMIERRPRLGIALERDGGAGGRWGTVEGGSVLATSTRGAITGRGARVFIIDDPIKDSVEAHSANSRQMLWDWWLSVAQTRLEPPYLVLVVMTRWHEDDFIGRLRSEEWEGAPKDWETISLPAIAGHDDAIGRSPGEPLLSAYNFDETVEQALARWEDTKRTVGTYTFSAMYQQSPAPAKGAIFDAGWWRYWTRDPNNVTDDGKVVLLDPSLLSGSMWLDSWDCAFKGTSDTDYVVGQRWVRHHANRYLITQKRERFTFTQTLAAMEEWAGPDPVLSPYGQMVHTRLIEDTANGPAILDTLRSKISGLKAINPRTSKEARARAITPEVESGNVFLPYPGDPGNDWVMDLTSELRNFPFDAHDDQVDAMTQALTELRGVGLGQITVPGRQPGSSIPRTIPQGRASAAMTDRRRTGGR